MFFFVFFCLVCFLIILTNLTHKLPLFSISHRSTWKCTLKDVTNDSCCCGNSFLLKRRNPPHILTSIWSLYLEGPSERDSIDLNRYSSSINKQEASGFKAKTTHLYFNWRVLTHPDSWLRTVLDRWWAQVIIPWSSHKGSRPFLKAMLLVPEPLADWYNQW